MLVTTNIVLGGARFPALTQPQMRLEKELPEGECSVAGQGERSLLLFTNILFLLFPSSCQNSSLLYLNFTFEVGHNHVTRFGKWNESRSSETKPVL